jgi:hypothetical protein
MKKMKAMKLQHRLFKVLLAVACLLPVWGYSQNYLWTSSIEKPQVDGFHSIIIDPDHSSLLNNEFSNIRIFDNEGKEISYLLRTESSISRKQLFKEYSILEKQNIEKGRTRLILSNDEKKKINNVVLVIKNADVTKEAFLYGSDDQKQWYAVKDRFYLSSTSSVDQVSELHFLNFPLIDYKYLKVEIIDSNSAPLNILSAGYYNTTAEHGLYQPIPTASIFQNDSSDKISYVHVSLNKEHFIDRLNFIIEGPRFYKRAATLYTKQIETTRREGKREVLVPVTELTLTSAEPTRIDLGSIKVKDLYLQIINEDNQPLVIKAVEAGQLRRTLIADLKKDSEYTMKIADKDLGSPDYDVKYFEDSIPAQLPVLNASAPVKISLDVEADSGRFFQSKVFIWICLGVIVVLLGYMTISMTRKVSGSEKE